MSERPQKHPFLRARTSYFEVHHETDIVNDEIAEFINEIEWRDFNRLRRHPNFTCFYGRDPFYDVVVVSCDLTPKNRLREYATDIYKGLYRRVEYSLKRDA